MLTVQDAKDLVEKKLEKRQGTTKPIITTTQLRKFLSAVNLLTNRIEMFPDEELSSELINEIQYLRVKLAYQAGRFNPVKDFAEKSKLDEEIQKIKTKREYMALARYLEAVVAYHKFNGGN